MKHILCYGDSNSWGSMSFGGRYPDAQQWPVHLQTILGTSFRVFQEGLCGRFAGELQEGSNAFTNGQSPFEAIYRSAMPLDYLIIALGTNDLKIKYKRSALQIYDDIIWYAKRAAQLSAEYGQTVQVVILAPANFISSKEYFYADSAVHEELLELFMDCKYPLIMLSDLEILEDGVHYTKADHKKVAKVTAEYIKELES